MKSLFSLLSIIVVTLATSISNIQAQQSKQVGAQSAKGKKMMAEFMKIPEEQRVEFNKKVRLAQKLYQEKRIFDALQAIDELDKIISTHPACLSLRGACYVELRAFDKAYAIFERLLAISPNSTNILFNLAELEFVTRKWEKSHQRFNELLTLLPEQNKNLRQLSEFKLLLCKLKTDRIDEARAMQNKYSEWDDTPYHYYAPAAILFYEGKDEEAKKLLRNALFIWRNPAQLSSWQDTMIEFGYVRSFYGSADDDANAGGNDDTDELAPETPQIAPVIPLDTE